MDEVRELRAILVGASPLLADLIRRVVEPRLRSADVSLDVIAELVDLADARRRLGNMNADIVIIAGAEAAPKAIEGWSGPILGLSADLSLVFGPGEGEKTLLTPESLAVRLVEFSS